MINTKARQSLRILLGVAALMVMCAGYSTVANITRPSPIDRPKTAHGSMVTDMAAAHRRITALERLVQRYREEVEHLDAANAAADHGNQD